jgi:excisionase family DNA binding protein
VKPVDASVTEVTQRAANQPVGLSLIAPPELIDAFADAVAARLANAVPAAPAQDGYLDVHGAAAFLSAPKSRIYDLVALKRLQPLKDGRRLLFRRADLIAYVENGGPE